MRDPVPQTAPNQLPEKYKFIGIFIVTSLLGVLLISVAVYKASMELELIHEIDNLYRFNQSHTGKRDVDTAWTRQLANDEFRIYRLRNDKVDQLMPDNSIGQPLLYPEILEESRINERGGYFDLDGQLYTWSMGKPTDTGDQLILLHVFQRTGFDNLAYVYSKRILIPAAFYVWLMVWVSLILSFLVNKLKLQSEAMEHMALHDPLSGLPNRNLLSDRFNKLIQTCHRHRSSFALVLIDLDRFKQINDTLGHEYGDDLLRQVAVRINESLRESDTAARIGGDEFILLLNDADRHSCIMVCERIEAALKKPYKVIAADINVGCSMGVAVFPEHGKDKVTLSRKADQAMYLAKANGGGIEVFKDSSEEADTEIREPIDAGSTIHA